MTAYEQKLKIDMKRFAAAMRSFCDNMGIPHSCKAVFSYRSRPDQMVPDCFRLFLDGGYPKEIFFNSAMFNDFWWKLPEDFRDSVATGEEIQRMKVLTLADSRLRSIVSRVLGKDYVNRGI